jgi:hypothetical protein
LILKEADVNPSAKKQIEKLRNNLDKDTKGFWAHSDAGILHDNFI